MTSKWQPHVPRYYTHNNNKNKNIESNTKSCVPKMRTKPKIYINHVLTFKTDFLHHKPDYIYLVLYFPSLAFYFSNFDFPSRWL